MNPILTIKNICNAGKLFCDTKTWADTYTLCIIGEWVLWLFHRTNPNDIKEITLAKGYCAQTVVHLMKDQRSIDAVNVAINYGQNLATEQELQDAIVSSKAAYDAIIYDEDITNAEAAYAAYCAVCNEYPKYAASSAATAIYNENLINGIEAATAAKVANEAATAVICKTNLPIGIWTIPTP